MSEYPYTDIDGMDYDRVAAHARNACLGGLSNVRDVVDRQRSLEEDQLVGQLGEFALYKYLGIPESYYERRKQIDLNPWASDGHTDFANMDVKTSLMRASKVPWSYHLVVRPRERQDGNVFVLAVVDQLKPPARVQLVGWAKDEELEFCPTGVFAGAWVRKGTGLHPMTEDLRWG